MMAAAEAGQIDCIRVLVNEMGCNKDVQDKVVLQMCTIAIVQASVCVHAIIIFSNFVLP